MLLASADQMIPLLEPICCSVPVLQSDLWLVIFLTFKSWFLPILHTPTFLLVLASAFYLFINFVMKRHIFWTDLVYYYEIRVFTSSGILWELYLRPSNHHHPDQLSKFPFASESTNLYQMAILFALLLGDCRMWDRIWDTGRYMRMKEAILRKPEEGHHILQGPIRFLLTISSHKCYGSTKFVMLNFCDSRSLHWMCIRVPSCDTPKCNTLKSCVMRNLHFGFENVNHLNP